MVYPWRTRPGELLALVCAGVDDPRPAPTTVIIVAHPDDEVVGAGARLPRLRQAVFVHVTDGAPYDLRDATANGFSTRHEYALARRQELIAALALAGIAPQQAHELGYVDQEATLYLADLSHRIATLLGDLQPTVVLTLPYEGGHPDHDATAFAVHAACRLLEQHRVLPPTLIEMTSYHNGSQGIVGHEFLPGTGDQVTTLVLSEAECDFKRRLLDCFPTQQHTLCWFSMDIECFRLAPRYDFTRPPHAGQLFYECFPWGMTGPRFRSLAHQAMQTLRLTGAL